jgi:C4-type Zn-finger protein
MNPSPMSEAFVADEVDRIIGSANIRIEQQRIHIEESSASPQQVTSARVVLERMVEVLDKLKRYRAKFT